MAEYARGKTEFTVDVKENGADEARQKLQDLDTVVSRLKKQGKINIDVGFKNKSASKALTKLETLKEMFGLDKATTKALETDAAKTAEQLEKAAQKGIIKSTLDNDDVLKQTNEKISSLRKRNAEIQKEIKDANSGYVEAAAIRFKEVYDDFDYDGDIWNEIQENLNNPKLTYDSKGIKEYTKSIIASLNELETAFRAAKSFNKGAFPLEVNDDDFMDFLDNFGLTDENAVKGLMADTKESVFKELSKLIRKKVDPSDFAEAQADFEKSWYESINRTDKTWQNQVTPYKKEITDDSEKRIKAWQKELEDNKAQLSELEKIKEARMKEISGMEEIPGTETSSDLSYTIDIKVNDNIDDGAIKDKIAGLREEASQPIDFKININDEGIDKVREGFSKLWNDAVKTSLVTMTDDVAEGCKTVAENSEVIPQSIEKANKKAVDEVESLSSISPVVDPGNEGKINGYIDDLDRLKTKIDEIKALDGSVDIEISIKPDLDGLIEKLTSFKEAMKDFKFDPISASDLQSFTAFFNSIESMLDRYSSAYNAMYQGIQAKGENIEPAGLNFEQVIQGFNDISAQVNGLKDIVFTGKFDNIDDKLSEYDNKKIKIRFDWDKYQELTKDFPEQTARKQKLLEEIEGLDAKIQTGSEKTQKYETAVDKAYNKVIAQMNEAISKSEDPNTSNPIRTRNDSKLIGLATHLFNDPDAQAWMSRKIANKGTYAGESYEDIQKALTAAYQRAIDRFASGETGNQRKDRRKSLDEFINLALEKVDKNWQETKSSADRNERLFKQSAEQLKADRQLKTATEKKLLNTDKTAADDYIELVSSLQSLENIEIKLKFTYDGEQLDDIIAKCKSAFEGTVFDVDLRVNEEEIQKQINRTKEGEPVSAQPAETETRPQIDSEQVRTEIQTLAEEISNMPPIIIPVTADTSEFENKFMDLLEACENMNVTVDVDVSNANKAAQKIEKAARKKGAGKIKENIQSDDEEEVKPVKKPKSRKAAREEEEIAAWKQEMAAQKAERERQANLITDYLNSSSLVSEVHKIGGLDSSEDSIEALVTLAGNSAERISVKFKNATAMLESLEKGDLSFPKIDKKLKKYNQQIKIASEAEDKLSKMQDRGTVKSKKIQVQQEKVDGLQEGVEQAKAELKTAAADSGIEFISEKDVQQAAARVNEIASLVSNARKELAEAKVLDPFWNDQESKQTIKNKKEEVKKYEEDYRKALADYDKISTDLTSVRIKEPDSYGNSLTYRQNEMLTDYMSSLGDFNRMLDNKSLYFQAIDLGLDDDLEKAAALKDTINDIAAIIVSLQMGMVDKDLVGPTISRVASKMKDVSKYFGSKYQKDNDKGHAIGNISMVDANSRQYKRLAEKAIKEYYSKLGEELSDIEFGKVGSSGSINYTARSGKGLYYGTVGLEKMGNGTGTMRLKEKDAGLYKTPFAEWTNNFKNKIISLSEYITGIELVQRAWNSIKQGFSFVETMDSALANINMTMSGTKEELNSLGRGAIKTGIDLSTNAENVLDAVTIYANANETAESILQKAQPTIMLSNASGADTSTVADQLQSVVEQFSGMQGQERRIASSYEKISANLAIDFAKGITIMADAVQNAGAVADQSGLNFETFAALTGKISEKTRQDGSSIGNMSKTIMARLSRSKTADESVSDKDRSNAAKAYGSIGISLYNDKGEYQDLDKTLDELSKKWSKLTDAERNYIAEQSAGTRGINVFTAMVESYQEAKQLAEEAINSPDFIDETQAKAEQKLSSHKEKLQASIQELYSSTLMPEAMNNVLDLGTSLIGMFANLTDTINGVSGAIFGAFGGEGVGKTLGSFTTLLTLGTTAVSSLDYFKRRASSFKAEVLGDKENQTTAKEDLSAAFSRQKDMLFNPVKTAFESLTSLSLDPIKKAIERNIKQPFADARNVNRLTKSYASDLEEEASLQKLVKGLRTKSGDDQDTFSKLLKETDNTMLNAKLAGRAWKDVKDYSEGKTSFVEKDLQQAKDTARASRSNGLLSSLFGFVGAHPYVSAALAATATVAGVAAWNNKRTEERKAAVKEETTTGYETYVKKSQELLNTKEQVHDLITRYRKLAAGVDTKTNRNISLSTDQMQEYRDVVNQLAQTIPSLAKSYDSTGTAIINSADLAARANKTLIQQQEEINAENVSHGASYIENYKNAAKDADVSTVYKDFWQEVSKMSYEDALKEVKKGKRSIFSAKGMSIPETFLALYDNDGTNAGIAEKTKKFGEDVSKTLEGYASIEQAASYVRSELGSRIALMQTQNALDYKNLSKSDWGNLQAFMTRTSGDVISEIAKGSFTENSYISEVLNALNNKETGGAIRQALSEIMSIDENSTVSQLLKVNDAINLLDASLTNVNRDQIVETMNLSENYNDIIDKMRTAQDSFDKMTQKSPYSRIADKNTNDINLENGLGSVRDGFTFQYNSKDPNSKYASLVYTPVLEDGTILTGDTLLEYLQDICDGGYDEDALILGRFEGVKDAAKFRKELEKSNKEAKKMQTTLPELFDELHISSLDDIQKAIDMMDRLSNMKVDDPFQYMRDNWAIESWEENVAQSKIDKLKDNLKNIQTYYTDFWNAVKENNTAQGLGFDTIDQMDTYFKDVEGYNYDKLFEATYAGTKFNLNELTKLKSKKAAQDLAEYNNQLDDLQKKYSNLNKVIGDSSSTDLEKLQAIGDRETVQDQIKQMQMIIGSYEGMTNAVAQWQMALSSGEVGDMFDTIATSGLSSVQKRYERGEVGTNEFRAFAQMGTNEDLAEASIDKVVQAGEHAMARVQRLFTETPGEGIYNGLIDLQAKGIASLEEDGTWKILGDAQEVADALQINNALATEWLYKTRDMGNDPVFVEDTDALNSMRKAAKSAYDQLSEDYKINMDATDIEDVTDNISKLEKAIKKAADPKEKEKLQDILDYFYARKGETITKEALGISEQDIKSVDDFIGKINEKYQMSIEIKWENQDPEYWNSKVDELNQALHKKGQESQTGKIEADDPEYAYWSSSYDTVIAKRNFAQTAANHKNIMNLDTSGFNEGEQQAIAQAQQVYSAAQSLRDVVEKSDYFGGLDDDVLASVKSFSMQYQKLMKENAGYAKQLFDSDKGELRDQVDFEFKEGRESLKDYSDFVADILGIKDEGLKKQIKIALSAVYEEDSTGANKSKVSAPEGFKPAKNDYNSALKNPDLYSDEETSNFKNELIDVLEGAEIESNGAIVKMTRNQAESLADTFAKLDNPFSFTLQSLNKMKDVLDTITRGDHQAAAESLKGLGNDEKAAVLNSVVKSDEWSKLSLPEKTAYINAVIDNDDWDKYSPETKEAMLDVRLGDFKGSQEIKEKIRNLVNDGTGYSNLSSYEQTRAENYAFQQKGNFGMFGQQDQIAMLQDAVQRGSFGAYNAQIRREAVNTVASSGQLDYSTAHAVIETEVKDDAWKNYQPEEKKAIITAELQDPKYGTDTRAKEEAAGYLSGQSGAGFSSMSQGAQSVTARAVFSTGQFADLKDEEKKVIIRYVEEYENDGQDWTPEDKEAYIRYKKDVTDANYDPEDKEANVNYKLIDGAKNYSPENKSATVTYSLIDLVSGLLGSRFPNITRTVTYNVQPGHIDGPAFLGRGGNSMLMADGSAHASGSAFANGSWGIGSDRQALVGELGSEILVRGDKWYDIGLHGAEKVKLKKGDIIFNHKQAEMIRKYGYVRGGKNGRGKIIDSNGIAHADGSAYVSGTWSSSGFKFYGGAAVYNSGGSGSGTTTANTNKKVSSGNNSNSSKKEDLNTLDEIEIRIDRITRKISDLDTIVNSTFRGYTERGKALTEEFNTVLEQISTAEAGVKKYLEKADSVGLSDDLKKRIREGAIQITDFNDSDLWKQIEDYKKWYELSLDLKYSITDLKEKLGELMQVNFNMLVDQFERVIEVSDNWLSSLNSAIENVSLRGMFAGQSYYVELLKEEENKVQRLQEEYTALENARNEALLTEAIIENSEADINMIANIEKVAEAYAKAKNELLEYKNAARDMDWKAFEWMQTQIGLVTQEAEFVRDLMAINDVAIINKDTGRFTDKGYASGALHAMDYNVLMAQADEYAKKVQEINKELATDPYNTILIDKKNEYIKAQQEAILAANNEKKAIRDLYKESYNKMLELLDKLISKRKEQLQAEKDLYDFERTVSDQSKRVNSLQKQLMAIENDDSEEAKARRQSISDQLKEAQKDLEATQYDQWIKDQETLMDKTREEYERVLNDRLDNIDKLFEEMIDYSNTNSELVRETITSSTQAVGYDLQQGLGEIWKENAGDVVAKYGDDFIGKLTTTNNYIKGIFQVLKETTKSKVEVEAPKKNQTPVQPAKTETTTAKKETTTANAKGQNITVGAKVNAGSAPIYWDSSGTVGPNGSKQYYSNDPVYIVTAVKGNYAAVRHHTQSGVAGWFKISDLVRMATGGYTGNKEGMAMLHKKERVLSAQQTAAFERLVYDFLPTLSQAIMHNSVSSLMNSTSKQPTTGDITQYITFELPNVKDAATLMEELKRNPKFTELIQHIAYDGINGKSSLRKNMTRFV